MATVQQLKDICKSHGITGYSHMRKAELEAYVEDQLKLQHTTEVLTEAAKEFDEVEEAYSNHAEELSMEMTYDKDLADDLEEDEKILYELYCDPEEDSDTASYADLEADWKALEEHEAFTEGLRYETEQDATYGYSYVAPTDGVACRISCDIDDLPDADSSCFMAYSPSDTWLALDEDALELEIAEDLLKADDPNTQWHPLSYFVENEGTKGARYKTLDELTAQAQELKMGYE